MNVFDIPQEVLRRPESRFLRGSELPLAESEFLRGSELPLAKTEFLRGSELPLAESDFLRSPEVPPVESSTSGIEITFSDQLRAYYQPDHRAMWSRWNPGPRPCFNAELLADIHAYHELLAHSRGQITYMGEQHPIEYVVLASDKPGVFNLGGDLDLFKSLIGERNRAELLRYGRACIDVLYSNYTAFDLPVTTISLVQGDALGGGFEAALSGDLIVAEKSARFGFPEILFNLFPGMGAYSFLDRRIGQRGTEEIISSGQLYSAEQMLEKGVIDVVVEDGQGEAGVAALITRRKRSQNGFAALAQARRRVHRIEFPELLDIVGIWVDNALRLNPRDLKLMQRLVSRQNGLGESVQLH